MLTYVLFHLEIAVGWVSATLKAILTIANSIPPWLSGLLGIIVARIKAKRSTGEISTVSVIKTEPAKSENGSLAQPVQQVNTEAVHRLIATELVKLLYRIRRRRLLQRRLSAHGEHRIKHLRRYVDESWAEQLRRRLAGAEALRDSVRTHLDELPPEQKRGAVPKAVESIALVLLVVVETSLTYQFVQMLIRLPKELSDYTWAVALVFALIVSGFAVYTIHHSAGIGGSAQSRARLQAWSVAVVVSGLAAYARFAGQRQTLTIDQILAGTVRGSVSDGIPQFVLSMLILVIAYGISCWSLPHDEEYRYLRDEYGKCDKEAQSLRRNLRWRESMDKTLHNMETEHTSQGQARDEEAMLTYQQIADAYIQRFILCGLVDPGDPTLERIRKNYERQLGGLFAARDQMVIPEISGVDPAIDGDVISGRSRQ